MLSWRSVSQRGQALSLSGFLANTWLGFLTPPPLSPNPLSLAKHAPNRNSNPILSSAFVQREGTSTTHTHILSKKTYFLERIPRSPRSALLLARVFRRGSESFRARDSTLFRSGRVRTRSSLLARHHCCWTQHLETVPPSRCIHRRWRCGTSQGIHLQHCSSLCVGSSNSNNGAAWTPGLTRAMPSGLLHLR